ncbi:MAG: anti-sigma factor family protein [Bacteroidota bacterium]
MRGLLVDWSYGELDPAGREICRTHLACCPSCREAADQLNAVRCALDRATFAPIAQNEADGAWRKVAARLTARQRRETLAFVGAAAGLLAAFWTGLAALDPRLPFYVQIGVILNLSLFYLPIHLLRCAKEDYA